MSSVTVVIPTFDRLAMLPRAIESVRSQTRRPEAVIVVDDGSTDGTAEWVAAQHPDITLIRQVQSGVSAARNRGIAAAKTTWIAFLDSDDAWAPRKLERQLAAVAGEPEAVLCHTDEAWLRNGQHLNPMKKHRKAGGWIFEACLPLCCISPSSAMVRRSLLESLGGFDESLPACEDYDLWLRICARHAVVFVEEKLVIKHGGHADQLSMKHWGIDRFRVRALEKLLGSDDLTPAQRRAALSMLVRKLRILQNGAAKRGKTGEAEDYGRRRTEAQRALESLVPGRFAPCDDVLDR